MVEKRTNGNIQNKTMSDTSHKHRQDAKMSTGAETTVMQNRNNKTKNKKMKNNERKNMQTK